MNQILATNNNESNKKKTVDIKRARAFFCIAIIIFGIVLISISAYNLYLSYEENKNSKQKTVPTIEIGQLDKTIILSVKYENGIDKIIYNWNNGEADSKPGDGKTSIETSIDMIEQEGENVLTVEVIGIDGQKNKISKTFEEEDVPVVVDEEKPMIQWIIRSNENKVVAIATDNTELKYIQYQWDSAEPVTVEPTAEQDKNKLEVDIEIIRGEHTLLVTAEDVDGNISTKSNKFNGVKKPEISAIKYDNVVEITVSHDMGFKKVEFIVNDIVYTYDKNYSEYSEGNTNLFYRVLLEEGENIIQVTAESLEKISKNSDEGTTAIYKGKCIYTPYIPEIRETNE